MTPFAWRQKEVILFYDITSGLVMNITPLFSVQLQVFYWNAGK